MITIQILSGSTRPGRFNIQPSKWILDIAQKRSGVAAELVDVQSLDLPFFDEPMPPMMQQYQNEHTKKFSKKISEADGYIFVTPEYNHSTSAVLKNAIDYLNKEWSYKAVGIVSYGSLAGGARAAEHLRGIAGELRMYDVREQVLIPNYWEGLDKNGQFQFSDRHESAANTMLDELIYWAGVMKEGRSKLSAKK